MNRQRAPLLIALAVLLLCACVTIALVAGGGALMLVRRSGATPVVAAVTRALPPTTRPLAPGETVTPAAGTTPDARQQGGSLRLPGGMPPTFDPALSGDSTSAQYIVEIFSGLVTADPNLELVTDIAQSYELSADGRTYTFHLRTGVKFHDGKAVTADDFRYSLERSLSPSTGSSIAPTYLGDIVGAREMLAGQAQSLAGVKVIDDVTLEITIDAPRSAFLAKLSHPVAFVVDRASIDSGSGLDRYNGTGPFRLAEVTPGDRIVLEANRDYYRDPRPALDSVIFMLGAGDSVAMYENGELDASPVGAADLPRITDPENPAGKELTISEQLSTFYVGLNCQEAPFDDLKVRQAFARAIDRQRIANILFDETVPAATGIVPPGMPGYEGATSDLTYDAAAAKQLLAESSYGGPSGLPPITLFISALGPSTDPVAEAVAYLIEQNLGVHINIQQADWTTYLDEIGGPNHHFQMFMLGWIADYPDPENFLNVLFSSGSGDNHFRYVNADVDRLLQEAGLEADHAQRQALYRQVETIVLNDAPVVPLYHDVEYWLTHENVLGATYPAMIVPRLQYISMTR